MRLSSQLWPIRTVTASAISMDHPKLDYLKARRGCRLDNALLSSPQVDFGYDVSDYEAIDPMYGHPAGLRSSGRGAKNAAFAIIMDFVLNHTPISTPGFSIQVLPHFGPP